MNYCFFYFFVDVVCLEGKFGVGCRYICLEYCIGICDFMNGECFECVVGWMGFKCMEGK